MLLCAQFLCRDIGSSTLFSSYTLAKILLLIYILVEVEIEQTGPLITPAVLPALNPQQTQNLAMAKKYCADVSSKFVS